jgi:hypothetical protein
VITVYVGVASYCANVTPLANVKDVKSMARPSTGFNQSLVAGTILKIPFLDYRQNWFTSNFGCL